MERTARRTHRQARVLGLLTALAAACATVQQPPGGPFDASPPVLLTISPDSGAVVTGFDDDVVFQFDEVIDERSGGQLRNLIHVSPRHDDVRVSWRRTRIGVKPRDGWRAGETYTVKLDPGIADLRQNRLDSARTIVFTTGTSIPNTRVSGNVVNWEEGRLAIRALIEMIRVSDSVTYVAATDSAGAFAVTAIPPGLYRLVATVDRNTNQRREGREAFDSALVTLDSIANFDLWTFVHDTTGPTMRNATIADSLAVLTEFTQTLAPVIANAHSARVLQLPDSTPVEVVTILWQPAFDSLRTAQRDSIAAALQDSLGVDSLALDSIVVADTATTDSIALEELEEEAEQDSVAVDSAEVARRDALLARRPRIYNRFVIALRSRLLPGEQYVIETRVTNLLGHAETSTRTLTVPVPADSVTTPRDST